MTTDKASTALRFDPPLLERLRAEAARRDVSVNYLVTKAVERALPAWEGATLDE